MRQVLALDLPRTLAGNLAPIGCEYQGIWEPTKNPSQFVQYRSKNRNGWVGLRRLGWILWRFGPPAEFALPAVEARSRDPVPPAQLSGFHPGL